jgi:hypothetical protein
MPIDARLFPQQFVKTCRDGVGVVSRLAACLPQVGESPMAREFAQILKVPSTNSFAAISRPLGLTLHWMGTVNITSEDLFRPSKDCELAQAVKKNRPRSPGERHGLVCLNPGNGLWVFSTWPPVVVPTSYPSGEPALPPSGLPLFANLSLRGIRYTAEPIETFAHRLKRHSSGTSR